MMLIALKNSEKEVYASSLAKEIDGTYSYIVKVLMDMEKAGLVEFRKQGRLKIIKLTSRGDSVAEKINLIRQAL